MCAHWGRGPYFGHSTQASVSAALSAVPSGARQVLAQFVVLQLH